jgi:magnesium transporter
MVLVREEPAARERDGLATLKLFRGDRAETLEGLDDVPSRLDSSSLLWIDLQQPSEATVDRLVEMLDLDDQAAAELVTRTEDASFRDGGRFVHVMLQAPDPELDDALTEIDCIVGQNWVLTSHERQVKVLEDLARLAEGSGPTGELDGPSFLATLFEWVLNEYALAFERVEEELEELDERAMQGHGSTDAQIDQLVALRRRTGRLRRSLGSHRSPLLALTQPEHKALGDASAASRFKELFDGFESTLQAARDARASIVSSFDVLIARTGHRTNEIVKVLTLASVILLPGSLLAGVMGMNFKEPLFEHTWGFWVVIAVILAIAVVVMTAAKVRRWI